MIRTQNKIPFLTYTQQGWVRDKVVRHIEVNVPDLSWKVTCLYNHDIT